jgi:hypothetical protein
VEELSIIPEDTRVVLVGASRFLLDPIHLPELPAVARNVEDLERVLADPQVVGIPSENIVVLLNERTPGDVVPRVADEARKAVDTFIFYYSGHGIVGKRRIGNLYLATETTTDENAEFGNAIPFEDIRAAISESTARKKILILDCCYSGRALPGAMGSEESVQQANLGLEGTYSIASAPANKVAIAPEGAKYTAFTGELLQILANGLDNGKEALTISDIYDHIRDQFRRRSNLPIPQQAMYQDAGSFEIAHNRYVLGRDFNLNNIADPYLWARNISDRGRFTNNVVDSAFSFDLSNIDLDRNLHTDLRADRGETIDLKYHYLGVRCASNWLALSGHYEYGHRNLIEAIWAYFDQVIDFCNFKDRSVDLVSLGSGDGELDAILLMKLNKMANLGYYYCIDISFELLQKAVARIIRDVDAQRFEKRFLIKAILGDFNQLTRLASIYTFDKSVNLFTLNGFTLGNYNEGDLLRSIRRGMGPEDLLFLDTRLHKLEEYDGSRELTDVEKQMIMSRYNNELNNRFAFGPVEVATNISHKSVSFNYEINHITTTVPKALNLVTYCSNLDVLIGNAGRDTEEKFHKRRLDLASTTLYSYNSLIDWLPTRGFHLLWHKDHEDIGLFLLKRIDPQ